jgi:fructosamine-3-kinase
MKTILEKIINKEFGSKILSIRDFTLGWSGAGVYAIETTENKLIVKLRMKEKEPSFEDESVDNRVYGSRFSNLIPAYKLLKEKEVLVPRLFAVGKQDNYIYAIMEELEGDAKISQEMVGEELGKIHAITREYHGWIDTTFKTGWKDDFFIAIDIQLKKAIDANPTVRGRVKEIESFIADKKLDWVNPKEFVLSHTDGFQAMAKEQDGKYILTGVIDLEDYVFTDQRFVLSGLDLLNDWWMNEKLSDQFWSNYKKHKEVDPSYTIFKNLFQLFYILSWLPGYYTNSQSDEAKKQATITEAEKRLFNLLK